MRDDSSPQPALRNHQDCRTLTGLVYERLPGARPVGRERKCRKGEMLWTSDSYQHNIYFLKRGQVVILLNDSAGCEIILRIIKPGEPFGELCFCSRREQTRDDCAQAVVDSELIQIDLSAFLTYLQQQPDALEAFTFTLCKRLADAEGRVEVLSHRGAESRLGRLLLQLVGPQKPKNPSSDVEITLPIGHDELARMAAMTRPHVSVTLGKLRERGLIQYSRGRPLTVNVTRLMKYLKR